MPRFISLKVNLVVAGLMLGALLSGSRVAVAQEQKDAKPAGQKAAQPGGRDPFFDAAEAARRAAAAKAAAKTSKPAKAVAKAVPPPPSLVKPPDIQARINFYKAQKQVAQLEQRTPPKPTTALLIEELEVAGIFRTPRGYAAMVQATPIKLSYVIYPGENLFDGQLVAIDDDFLVFRHNMSWSDGRTETRVERKALRQPAPPNALAEEKTAPGAATAPATPAGAAQPAATPTAPPPVPAAPPAPGKAVPPNYANPLFNGLPSSNDERNSSKPAPEFTPSPTAEPVAPADDKAAKKPGRKPVANKTTKGKATKPATPAAKPAAETW